MNCKNCIIRDFVHADLYCRGCTHKPKPKIKTGRAYLFRKDKSEPIFSSEIEAPKGLEYEFAAIELMSQFRIEFIEHDTKELAQLVFDETK